MNDKIYDGSKKLKIKELKTGKLERGVWIEENMD